MTGGRFARLHTDLACAELFEGSTFEGPMLPAVAARVKGPENCEACAPDPGIHSTSWASIALPRNFSPGRTKR